MSVGVISGRELSNLLHQDPDTLLIVDVREDDYTRGKILKSINIPFYTFSDGDNASGIHKIQERLKENPRINMIITHCHYCQTRGPKAAKILSKHVKGIPVYYLQGGWAAWVIEYPDLCEPL